MPVTLTHSALSNPIDRTEIDQNFADVEAWSGNISNADIASDADIEIDKLAAKYQEVHLKLEYAGGAGLPAATTVMDVVTLPGNDGDEAWEYLGHTWVCTDTGDGTGKIEFDFGYYDAAGTFQSTSLDSGATTTLANSAAGADSANQGGATDSVGSGDAIPFTSNIQTIRMICNTQGANYLTAATDFLTVTIILMRRLQES
jgi:hypothetical protein